MTFRRSIVPELIYGGIGCAGYLMAVKLAPAVHNLNVQMLLTLAGAAGILLGAYKIVFRESL